MTKAIFSIVLSFYLGIYSVCLSNDTEYSEYSFEVEEFEKKPYEFSGNLSFKPTVSILNADSRLYKLKYLDSESENVLDEYNLSIEALGSYEISKFKFLASGKYDFVYNTSDEQEYDFHLFEFYSQYSVNTNFTAWLGKKTVKWGKGYIWNPVAFVGRQKDVNDVDASLEGYSLVMGQFVKSFDSTLKNISISPILIPVTDDLNSDFSSAESVNIALQVYMLIADTDVDLYLFADDQDHYKIGVDFARNLLTNWEIHAELAFENSYTKSYIDETYSLQETTDGILNYIIGTRYLTSGNTTIIFEYLHNDKGYSDKEMSNFYNATDTVLVAGSRQNLSLVKSFQKNEMNRQFLMKDYLYLKASKPEPFDILYITPSAYMVYNLNDNSTRFGFELKYNRFENIELLLRQSYFPPKSKTEFGEKLNEYKTELYITKYF